MKTLKNLNSLMLEQMRSLYDAENHITVFLKKLRAEATRDELAAVINDYIVASENQLLKIKRSFNHLYELKRGENCDAIDAMIVEGNELLKRCESAEVRDAAIVTILQHIIHYKIAGYGAVCTYAKMLELHDVSGLLHPGLDAEKKTDRRLAILAEELINPGAIHHN